MTNKKQYEEMMVKLNSLLCDIYCMAETKQELKDIYYSVVNEVDDAYSMYEDEVPEYTEEKLEAMNWPDTMENLGIRLGDFL